MYRTITDIKDKFDAKLNKSLEQFPSDFKGESKVEPHNIKNKETVTPMDITENEISLNMKQFRLQGA